MAMDEQRVLGHLEEFKRSSEKRFDKLEQKIDSLNEFKWRMTGSALVIGIIISAAITIIAEWMRPT